MLYCIDNGDERLATMTTTKTTIYTADALSVERVRYESGLDFTTWLAQGSWKGVPEVSRVWEYIAETPIARKLFITAISEVARSVGESAIYVVTQQVESELVDLGGVA